jgi:hypothetical protein
MTNDTTQSFKSIYPFLKSELKKRIAVVYGILLNHKMEVNEKVKFPESFPQFEFHEQSE